MSINNIIIYIMVFFMLIGAIDRIFNNRFGYGKKFEDGIMTMGTLALAMLGIISFSPVISSFLKPIISPFYRVIGADPAMFAGTILASDMGGYILSQELALTHDSAMFSGLFLSATMGTTLSFSIPVALGIVDRADEKYISKGILAGISTIPLGCFVGGVIAGFQIKLLFLNLIPIIAFTFLICWALLKFPKEIAKGFFLFGKFMFILTTIGLALQILETLTGVVVIKGMLPIMEGVKTVGSIAITLAGAFPMLYFVTTVFTKPLTAIGKMFRINEKSTAGLIACLAHNIPMFNILKEMDERGKLLNIAFSVSGAFVLGSHLGFTAGIDKDLVFPVIITKLVGGVSSMFVANYIYNKEFKHKKPLN